MDKSRYGNRDSALDHRNESPQRNVSVLEFAMSRGNKNSKTTRLTREYKKYAPQRYKVKSKVS